MSSQVPWVWASHSFWSEPQSRPVQPPMQMQLYVFGPMSSQVPWTGSHGSGSQSSRSVQVRPSPSQPDRQRQNQSPGTLTQRASTWQSWVLEVHSLMSKSQLKSVNPSWHVHVYEAAPLSSQVPKAHGFEAQSSTSLQPAPWA